MTTRLASLARGQFYILSAWQLSWLVYFAAIFAGFATAGQGPTTQVFWASYFGRLSLGTVQSISSPFTIVFGAVGPLFAGWVYDTFGSYQVAFAFFTGASVSAVVLMYLSRPQKKRAKGDGDLAALQAVDSCSKTGYNQGHSGFR